MVSKRRNMFHKNKTQETTEKDNPDPIHTRTVLNDLDSPLPMSVPPPAFSSSKVKYAISKLPTPGFDLITSTILRQNSHSTIQQCQRVVDNIASCLEQKQYCSAAFLDVAQAFDRPVGDEEEIKEIEKFLTGYRLIGGFRRRIDGRQLSRRQQENLGGVTLLNFCRFTDFPVT
ncbi:hypothetical protein AAG570_009017 [Ranatra chinensis]|uniref:Reverse transcriptase domain-containing protein n=1 Tax=Ranatra chinensis TaxID=642074 RepID=A0ABD0YSW2_9HEMI